jgi:hypothetical protein
MRYRFVRTLLRQLVQELLESGPGFPVLAEGQRLHPAQLIELPLPRPHHRHSYPGHLLVEIHSLLLDLYRDLSLPLLHTRLLRTIVIRMAAVRAHALQALIQGHADLQIGHDPLSLPDRMPAQVLLAGQDARASTPRTSPDRPRPAGRV